MDDNNNRGVAPEAVELPVVDEPFIIETNEAQPGSAQADLPEAEPVPLETNEVGPAPDVPAGPQPGDDLPLLTNQVESAVVEEAPPAEPSGLRCEFCGQEYPEKPGKFCDRCGRVISRFHLAAEDEVPAKICKKCGHKNKPEENICVNCGDRLYERQSV